MIIYKATNKINGKSYIGQTSFSLEKRKFEHEKSSRKKKCDSYFHRALKKYKPKNFIWECLYECDDREELDEAEIRFIEEYNTFGDGYNLTKGGGGSVGYIPTEETIKKISKRTKEGIKKSEKSWSDSHMGNKNGMYGKKHSQSSIEKMKKNRKGLTTGKNNPSSKNAGLYKITFPDGSTKEIKNVRKFCRDNKLCHVPFYEMCNGKRTKKFKGYWCERIEHSLQRKKELGIL